MFLAGRRSLLINKTSFGHDIYIDLPQCLINRSVYGNDTKFTKVHIYVRVKSAEGKKVVPFGNICFASSATFCH